MTVSVVPGDESLPYSPPRKAPWLRPELVASWREIALVLLVMLGPFAWSSNYYALTHSTGNYFAHLLNDRKFLGYIATESLLLSVMFGYLRWRGWKPADFRIGLGLKGTVEAPVVALGGWAVNSFTVGFLIVLTAWLAPHPDGIAAAFIGQAPHIEPHSIAVSWFFLVTVSVLNAFLEELVFMGYAFNQFAAKLGPSVALVMMMLLRMLLHTYQGPIHCLGIGAFSLFFGLAYMLLRRLWPLILAHAAIDIVSFSLLKIYYG